MTTNTSSHQTILMAIASRVYIATNETFTMLHCWVRTIRVQQTSLQGTNLGPWKRSALLTPISRGGSWPVAALAAETSDREGPELHTVPQTSKVMRLLINNEMTQLHQLPSMSWPGPPPVITHTMRQKTSNPPFSQVGTYT